MQEEFNAFLSKIANPTKVITGVNTRRSYANVWDPKSINGAAPKYSVSLIIPKSDTVTVNKIKAAIGILITRVAKSGNHANLKRLCSCHMLPFVTQKFNQRQRLPRPPKARKGCSKVISENSCPETAGSPGHAGRGYQSEHPAAAKRRGRSRDNPAGVSGASGGMRGSSDYSAKSPPTSVETGSSW